MVVLKNFMAATNIQYKSATQVKILKGMLPGSKKLPVIWFDHPINNRAGNRNIKP
jgi:hypothetical protein